MRDLPVANLYASKRYFGVFDFDITPTFCLTHIKLIVFL